MPQSPVVDTLEAIAAVEDREPDTLDFVLEEHVSTTAIHSLVNHGDTSWELSFEVSDHYVTITGTGRIDVDGVHRTTWG